MSVLIAHRGLVHPDNPEKENTLEAFVVAFQTEGIAGIEIDVHGTADHQLVVSHDSVLPNSVKIGDLERKEMPLLPGIEDVLDLHAAFRTKILQIEVKACSLKGLFRLAVLIDRQTMRTDPANIYLLSFDHTLLRILKKLVSPLVRTVAHCEGPMDLWALGREFDYVGLQVDALAAHRYGFEGKKTPTLQKTWVWTRGAKYEETDAVVLRKHGAAGFISDTGQLLSTAGFICDTGQPLS